jgi:predicted Zn-dependent protease
VLVWIFLSASDGALGQDNPRVPAPDVFTSDQNVLSSEENSSQSEWGLACTDVFERAQLKRVIQAKQWPKAKQIANGLIERCPNTGIGQYWVGIIEFKQGNFIEALHNFEAAVDRAPTVPRVHLNLGVAYLMINQFKLFEDEMLWLTTHDPKNPLPFYYLGRYYSKRFDDPQEKASMFFEQALVRNPTDYQSRYHLGYIYELRGAIEMARKEYQAAWQEVSSEKGNYSLPLQGLARLCFSEEQTAQGLKYAEQAVWVDAKQSGNYLVSGKLYLQAQDYSKSVAALKRAAELEPINPTPHYLLARAYRESGQRAEAEKEIALFAKIKLAYRNE